MDALDRVINALSAKECRPRGGNARCPSHEDRNASLTYAIGTDGRALVNCHAGCTFDDVLVGLNLAASDLFPESEQSKGGPTTQTRPARSRVVATYPYTDADGTLLYEAIRREPKDFRQRLADGSWKGPQHDDKVLYRLPEVIDAVAADRHVIIVEGEKDADRLAAAGLVATTSIGGAGKWQPAYADSLAGATVVVLPDNDDAGRRHAADIIASLLGTAATIRVVELPDLAPKGDVSDWLDAGGTVEELQDLCRQAPTVNTVPDWLADPAPDLEDVLAPPPAARLEFLPISELAAAVDAEGPRSWLLRGVWPAGDYGFLHAAPKAQKSWTALDMALAVASGTPWLGHVPVDTTGPVLIFWGEGGRAGIVRRLRALATQAGADLDTLPIHVRTRAPHLTDAEHMTDLAAYVEQHRPALVIIDPFYLAARGSDKGDLTNMGALLEAPQLICQAAGASLLVVHHDNRGDGKGAARASGAGPWEWSRVLLSATVKVSRTDAAGRTTVTTELEVTGGEVPGANLRVVRDVWADDPDDLNSPLHVSTTVDTEGQPSTDDVAADLAPADRKVLESLQAARRPETITELTDRIAEIHGHGLKRNTVSGALNKLADLWLADAVDEGAGQPKRWFTSTSTSPVDNPPREGVSQGVARVSHDTPREGVSRDRPPRRGGDTERDTSEPPSDTPNASDAATPPDQSPRQAPIDSSHDEHGRWAGGAL